MIPLDKRYVSTEFFDSREHPRFGTWVGLGDVGHEDVGDTAPYEAAEAGKRRSRDSGTRGRGTQKRRNSGTWGLEDMLRKQLIFKFCAELLLFVKYNFYFRCSRERK